MPESVTQPAPTAPTPPAVLGLTSEEFAAAQIAIGAKGGRVGALERYRALFLSGVTDIPGGPVQVAPVRRTLSSQCAEGTTLKFTQLVRGRREGDPPLETESVLIPMVGRKGHLTYTLCVSSQVGCAMGCVFCQTAQMGLIRSLEPCEIVQQWFAATHLLGYRVSNIVFMGMGEPMDNLDAVIKAISVLTDHRGVALPMSKIVVSTVGRVDGIRRLGAKVREHGWRRLNLAISLNAPNDEIRRQIMPINRAMPMAELRAALEEWPIYGGAKICFEYVLIPGVNDRPEHAAEVTDFILGRGTYQGRPPLVGMVNLIPYNPRDGSPWPAPEEADVDLFLSWLLDGGVYAKRRRTKGRETMAACGQLGNPALRRRPRAGAPPAGSPVTLTLSSADPA